MSLRSSAGSAQPTGLASGAASTRRVPSTDWLAEWDSGVVTAAVVAGLEPPCAPAAGASSPPTEGWVGRGVFSGVQLHGQYEAGAGEGGLQRTFSSSV